MKRSCSSCKFGIRYVDGEGKTIYYECRFNPPLIYSYPLTPGTPALTHQSVIYPRLQEHDWCYRYKKLKEVSNG